MIAATNLAVGNKNQTNINLAKNLLLEIAKVNTLHNSIGYEELKTKPKCWENNDPKAPCWYHEFEFAGQWFGNYMISAIMLKSELDKEEFLNAIPRVIYDIESYDTTTVRASVGNWLISKYIKNDFEIGFRAARKPRLVSNQ